MRGSIFTSFLAAPAKLALALSLLSGCGGGGDDSSPALAPPPLTISPTTVSASAMQGTSATMTATATLNTAAVNGDTYVAIQDVRGVIESVDFAELSATTASVTLYIVTTLSIGEHTGNLDFFVCKDSGCTSFVSDKPARLSYTITITPAPPAAVVTPDRIVASLEADDKLSIEVTARIAATIYAGGFRANDPQGLFSSAVTTTSVNGQDYLLTLTVPPKSTVGTFSGTLNLEVCNGDCAYSPQVPGSPIQIPYAVTVIPFVPLPPVPTVSGLPEWETYQGNAGHTGFVPVTLNATQFVPRWSWSLPSNAGGTLSPVTMGSGKVIVSASGSFQPAYLFALNELDGSVAWRHNFESIFAINHPATAGGRVFVASSGHDDTFMWAFDLADGTQIFKTRFLSQWEHYLAPTFRNGFVYTNGGYYGGMYAFKATSGAEKWFAPLGQYELWSPAVDDNYAYAYTGYEFTATDLRTGTRAFTVADPAFNWWGYSLNMSPVLPGDGSVLLVNGVFDFGYGHPNQLIRYSIAGGSETWRVDGDFESNPVVAAGIIYVLNAAGNRLEARSQSDGALLWSWTPVDPLETVPVGNLVLTENLLFLSSSVATYAIDLGTRQAVWSTPQAGKLAMSSNRVLYIVTSVGTIEAITLH
jgi:outer membrane protein assembly factor BamB